MAAAQRTHNAGVCLFAAIGKNADVGDTTGSADGARDPVRFVIDFSVRVTAPVYVEGGPCAMSYYACRICASSVGRGEWNFTRRGFRCLKPRFTRFFGYRRAR